jgi:hypothetical protein
LEEEEEIRKKRASGVECGWYKKKNFESFPPR